MISLDRGKWSCNTFDDSPAKICVKVFNMITSINEVKCY